MLRHHSVKGKDRHLSGWKKDRPDHRDHLLALPAAAVPTKADVHSICPPIEDQGEIGSCTANSSTSMMESLYRREKMPALDLSRLYLYWTTRVRIEGTAAGDDSGCELRDVMKALSKYGCCVESLWPYDVSKFSSTPPPTADAGAKAHKIIRYQRADSLQQFMASIAQGYTLVGGFSVPQNMMSEECARTGVVKFPAPDEEIIGGHAVMFVGYDQATRLLTFQNSWGAGWGQNGFGRLPFAFIEHRLADDFWTLRAET